MQLSMLGGLGLPSLRRVLSPGADRGAHSRPVVKTLLRVAVTALRRLRVGDKREVETAAMRRLID
jgi:hypothetical protein